MNLALLAAAATGVQVGAAIVATRYVVAEVPPLTLALLRYAIGVATLLPFAWHALRNGRRWPQATHPRRDLAAMAALGIGQFAVLIALLNFGLQTVGAARGALIFSLFPVLTLLLATAAGRERWNTALAAGVALSVAGVMLDVVPRLAAGGEAPMAWPGALAVLGSALTGAVCSVAYRPYLQRYPTLPVSVLAMGASVLFLAVLAYIIYHSAGIRSHGPFGYLKHALVPPGVPPALLILVVPIEFISKFLVQPFSHTVRLFANLLAGHILLVTFAVLTSALWTTDWYAIFLPLPAFAVVFFTAFELLVSFLQAYVFTLLTGVYINAAASHEH